MFANCFGLSGRTSPDPYRGFAPGLHWGLLFPDSLGYSPSNENLYILAPLLLYWRFFDWFVLPQKMKIPLVLLHRIAQWTAVIQDASSVVDAFVAVDASDKRRLDLMM